jgi:hypothetical protein
MASLNLLPANRAIIDQSKNESPWPVAVRVASFELVLPFLEQAQRRQALSLSALQQRSACRPVARASPIRSSPNTCWPLMTTSSPLPRSAAVEAVLPLLLNSLILEQDLGNDPPGTAQ